MALLTSLAAWTIGSFTVPSVFTLTSIPTVSTLLLREAPSFLANIVPSSIMSPPPGTSIETIKRIKNLLSVSWPYLTKSWPYLTKYGPSALSIYKSENRIKEIAKKEELSFPEKLELGLHISSISLGGMNFIYPIQHFTTLAPTFNLAAGASFELSRTCKNFNDMQKKPALMVLAAGAPITLGLDLTSCYKIENCAYLFFENVKVWVDVDEGDLIHFLYKKIGIFQGSSQPQEVLATVGKQGTNSFSLPPEIFTQESSTQISLCLKEVLTIDTSGNTAAISSPPTEDSFLKVVKPKYEYTVAEQGTYSFSLPPEIFTQQFATQIPLCWKNEFPAYFRCPLTQAPIRFAVQLKDCRGFFEKSALIKALQEEPESFFSQTEEDVIEDSERLQIFQESITKRITKLLAKQKADYETHHGSEPL